LTYGAAWRVWQVGPCEQAIASPVVAFFFSASKKIALSTIVQRDTLHASKSKTTVQKPKTTGPRVAGL